MNFLAAIVNFDKLNADRLFDVDVFSAVSNIVIGVLRERHVQRDPIKCVSGAYVAWDSIMIDPSMQYIDAIEIWNNVSFSCLPFHTAYGIVFPIHQYLVS